MRQLWTDLRGNPIYRAPVLFRRNRACHLPPLFCLVRNQSWADVIKRSKRHPNEVLIQEEATGNTSLHIACRLNPPKEVVKALSSAVRIKNMEGCTPLHVAASHRCSVLALEVLLESASSTNLNSTHPSHGVCHSLSPTSDLSRCGRSPLHYACGSFRGLELNAFKLLLEKTMEHGNLVLLCDERNPSTSEEDHTIIENGYNGYEPASRNVSVLTLRDSAGHTPLGLLFRRYRERMKRVSGTVDRLWKDHQETPSHAALAAAMAVHADLGGLWEKARLMVAKLSAERLQHEERDATYITDPRSPGETAIAQEAAAWAAEQHGATFLTGTSTSDMFEDLTSDEEDETCNSERQPNSSTQLRQFRILHASVGLIGYGCPLEMIRLLISIYPNQVREMDEDGNLPIHIAATARSYHMSADEITESTLTAAAASAAAAADDDSIVSDTALSLFSSATMSKSAKIFDKVIKLLLQYYPDAARIPQGRTGRLPFVLATESGMRTWNDGIATILKAYPPAMFHRSISLELYPHILSLITKRNFRREEDEEPNNLTALYHLLKTRPEWVTYSHKEAL